MVPQLRILGPLHHKEKTRLCITQFCVIHFSMGQFCKTRLMQDGARPHFVPTVHAGHYNHFPDQCIGHQEPIIWPPQSPCFTPCDFFVVVRIAQRESLPITTQNT
jgi:hypothetical protein